MNPPPPRQAVIGHEVLDDREIRRRIERSHDAMRKAGIDPHQAYAVKHDVEGRKIIVEQG